ncbi:MAG: hypothetical protein KJ066_16220 [Acidobacteria bacterium]|nr:hypothetical protein [Acidobacteriota bacterium]
MSESIRTRLRAALGDVARLRDSLELTPKTTDLLEDLEGGLVDVLDELEATVTADARRVLAAAATTGR